MLKRLRVYALGIAIAVAMLAIPLLFLRGAIWASTHLLKPLIALGWWLLAATVLVALPLSILKRLRGAMAVAILYSSFVYGLIAWLTGFVITYLYWGVFGVVVGLFLAGIGVVPIGLLASALHGWDGFAPLVVLVALTFGSRVVALMLAASAERHQESRPSRSLTDAEKRAAIDAFDSLIDKSDSG